jgi:hypothetical protein
VVKLESCKPLRCSQTSRMRSDAVNATSAMRCEPSALRSLGASDFVSRNVRLLIDALPLL